MGTLLSFQPPAQSMRPVLPTAEKGKLLLFTGVRYERMVETDRADMTAPRKVEKPLRRS